MTLCPDQTLVSEFLLVDVIWENGLTGVFVLLLIFTCFCKHNHRELKALKCSS